MTTSETSKEILRLCELAGVEPPTVNGLKGASEPNRYTRTAKELLPIRGGFTTDDLLKWDGWGKDALISISNECDASGYRFDLFQACIETRDLVWHTPIANDPAEALGLLMIERLKEMVKENESNDNS